MQHEKYGASYLILIPVILCILIGLFKAGSLKSDNRKMKSQINNNQATVRSLEHKQNETNGDNYVKQFARQGTDLYRELPRLATTIDRIMIPAYTKISSSSDYDYYVDKIKAISPGSLTSTVLTNAKPRIGQTYKQPTSPYASVKDVHVDSKYSNYTAGNIIVLTEVDYTLPGRTVMDGRRITLPSSKQQDYYLSSYNFSNHQLDSIMDTHNQQIQGGNQ